ncbi:MAG: hypothetical protein DBX59_08100 [Bacillota bacterium]|nr:MAG: hypothetical protein DBX59_08100 [Bacillota bacterium]
MKNIVNVINFVRGIDTRVTKESMFELTKKEYELVAGYGFHNTFLLQYDTLLDEKYISFFKNRSSVTEIGLWLEVVQSLAEAVGLKWRGREGFPFDWHCHCGMLVGYAPKEREMLLDEAMNRFKSVYGEYPKSVGSWLIDAHSLKYLADKYHIDASCNCKEQWGTDGYTLWGGYFNQAYYPCENNMLCPAQSAKQQIDVPVFRMLGSDPIDQYDVFLRENAPDVITMEPGCKAFGGDEGGHVPEWIDWFLKETFSGNGVSFQYTQTGQENSCFTWEHIGFGLKYQLEEIKKLVDAGKADVMTLGESGRWVKEHYAFSPVCAQTAFGDFRGKDRGSVWINTKNYRFNVFLDGDAFRIRDFYLFNENYKERYLNAVCTANDAAYDNLPVLDGLRNSTRELLAGVYPFAGKTPVRFSSFNYSESETGARLAFETERFGEIAFAFTEGGICLTVEKDAAAFKLKTVTAKPLAAVRFAAEREIGLEYNGFSYSLRLQNGKFGDHYEITPENGRISVKF